MRQIFMLQRPFHIKISSTADSYFAMQIYIWTDLKATQTQSLCAFIKTPNIITLFFSEEAILFHKHNFSAKMCTYSVANNIEYS